MARNRSWMPMFWGDYLRDTMHLTTDAHGAYLLLIASYWCTGKPPPDDDKELARITRLHLNRWRSVRPQIERYFQISEGVWSQKRIDTELSKSKKISDIRSANAKQMHLRARITPQPHTHKKGIQAHSNPENPSLPFESDIPPVATQPPPKGGNGSVKRGSRLSPDWEPKPETLAFCRERFKASDRQLQEIYEGWMDWGLSATGPHTVKIDWDRAFINAVRKEMRRVQEADERERRRAERYARPG